MIESRLTSTERLHDALRRMLGRYPYHAEWLSESGWNPLPSIGTMAVMLRKGSPHFFYSRNFVSECEDGELEGVVHHELNHLVFGHPRIDHSMYPNHQALTIADEVTLNAHVPERLPGTPLLLEQFPELPPLEDTIRRYHRLAERTDFQDRIRTLDTHALWKLDAVAEVSEADREHIRPVLMGQLRSRNGNDCLCRLMRGGAQLDGGEMMRQIAATIEPIPPVNWKRILACLTGYRIRRQANFHRPPQRMPARIGVIPGTECRPDQPRVLVAIDTSSPMQRSHFERIRRKLEALQQEAHVTVIQCDKQIRENYRLTGSLQTITGRGGTHRRPPFEPTLL